MPSDVVDVQIDEVTGFALSFDCAAPQETTRREIFRRGATPMTACPVPGGDAGISNPRCGVRCRAFSRSPPTPATVRPRSRRARTRRRPSFFGPVTREEDLTPDEMGERAMELFSKDVVKARAPSLLTYQRDVTTRWPSANSTRQLLSAPRARTRTVWPCRLRQGVCGHARPTGSGSSSLQPAFLLLKPAPLAAGLQGLSALGRATGRERGTSALPASFSPLNPTEEANISTWFAAAGVSCALALSGCALAPSEREEFERRPCRSAEGTFALSNVNGSVAVESWEREEVVIRAIKTGSRVRDSLIEVTGGGDRVQVRTRLPRWFLSWGRGDTIVEYRVRVPDEVTLELETVNGGVARRGCRRFDQPAMSMALPRSS